MKLALKLLMISTILLSISCGKKSNLKKYPGSEYPREYPKDDNESI